LTGIPVLSYNEGMRISEGVEWGVHCCTLLAVLAPGQTLPAPKLAEYHGVPPAYLAKHLQSLSRAGLVESVSGPRGGYRLARSARTITILDVVEAIEGDEPAFRCTEIRQRGPAAARPSAYRDLCGIARVMLTAEDAWKAELRAHTIAELVGHVMEDAPSEALARGAAWLQSSAR
jgi:Rrf2 family protein